MELERSAIDQINEQNAALVAGQERTGRALIITSLCTDDTFLLCFSPPLDGHLFPDVQNRETAFVGSDMRLAVIFL